MILFSQIALLEILEEHLIQEFLTRQSERIKSEPDHLLDNLENERADIPSETREINRNEAYDSTSVQQLCQGEKEIQLDIDSSVTMKVSPVMNSADDDKKLAFILK